LVVFWAAALRSGWRDLRSGVLSGQRPEEAPAVVARAGRWRMGRETTVQEMGGGHAVSEERNEERD
jgi:hypothetical protein